MEKYFQNGAETQKMEQATSSEDTNTIAVGKASK